MEQGLSLDLRVYKANTRNSINILSGRTGIVSDDAIIDDKQLKLGPNEYFDLPQLPNGRVFIMYSYHPLVIEGTIGSTAVEIPNQTLFIITTAFNNVRLTNTGSELTRVHVIKMTDSSAQSDVEMPRQLVTFAALSRITQLPQPVVNPLNFVVEDLTQDVWTRDQTSAPNDDGSTSQRYRICDSDGTPNLNGSYIMILDDIVSQQNFSGTLQLYVSETTT